MVERELEQKLTKLEKRVKAVEGELMKSPQEALNDLADKLKRASALMQLGEGSIFTVVDSDNNEVTQYLMQWDGERYILKETGNNDGNSERDKD